MSSTPEKTPTELPAPEIVPGYVGISSFDLSEAPVGQAFLLNRHNSRMPLAGVIADPTWPIAFLRERAFGSSVARWLQLPGHEGLEANPQEDKQHKNTGSAARISFLPDGWAGLIGHLSDVRHSEDPTTGPYVPPTAPKMGESIYFVEVDKDGKPVVYRTYSRYSEKGEFLGWEHREQEKDIEGEDLEGKDGYTFQFEDNIMNVMHIGVAGIQLALPLKADTVKQYGGWGKYHLAKYTDKESGEEVPEPLTLQELYDQLPTLGMTDEVELTMLHPTGEEREASVAYSSDLKCMAIMEYDKDYNILRWVPLPTKKTSYFTGFGANSYIANDWPDGKAPESDVRFVVKPKTELQAA